MRRVEEILAPVVGEGLEEPVEEAGKIDLWAYILRGLVGGRFSIHEKVKFAVDAFYVIYDATHTLYTQRHTYLHSSGDLTLHGGAWDLDIVLRFYARP